MKRHVPDHKKTKRAALDLKQEEKMFKDSPSTAKTNARGPC